MANYIVKDYDDNDIEFDAEGAGTTGDPHRTKPAQDPFGLNADAAATAGSTGSMQAKFRLMTSQLDAIKTAVEGETPAGTNNIGDVDVASVPADPFGTNADAASGAGAVGSIQAKLRQISADLDAVKTAVEGATPAGTNNIGDVDVVSLPALPSGTNNIGDVDVASLPSIPAGANNIGDVGIASALPAGTNEIGKVAENPTAATGGLETSRVVSSGSGNDETAVSTVAGRVYSIDAANETSGWVYLHLYDAATGSVTPGTTTPDRTIPIPPYGAVCRSYPCGIGFATAITATLIVGLTGSTSPAANEVVFTIGFKD